MNACIFIYFLLNNPIFFNFLYVLKKNYYLLYFYKKSLFKKIKKFCVIYIFIIYLFIHPFLYL